MTVSALTPSLDTALPISIADVYAARDRIRPYLEPTPFRSYGTLDAEVGADIRVMVKHENFNPTNAFKIRNALSFMTALSDADRTRGVVAATRGNHGLGIAWAGLTFGVPVTICVPRGNNPEKNAAVRALGATLIEEGDDYDESVAVADRVRQETGAVLAHSTNNANIIAGAGTLSLEMVEQAPDLDAVVIGVGGGSQAVGALTVAHALRPSLRVYAVQAAGAAATYNAWHTGVVRTIDRASTFADGLATRSAYEMTFPALRIGLAGFVTVTEAELADALRMLLRTTHTLVEGAGAAGLAGLLKLRDQLSGRRVGIVLSGSNIDEATLRMVVNGAL
jgi:threonine dehydratase